MSNAINLRPCPFCGSADVNLVCVSGADGEERCIDGEEELNDESVFAFVHCHSCGIDFISDAGRTPKDVFEAWNSRA